MKNCLIKPYFSKEAIRIADRHMKISTSLLEKCKQNYEGLPWCLSGKESTCQCRRHRFNPWSRNIPHASEQLTHAPQLLSLCYRAWEPKLPSPHTATSEACAPRACALQQEWSPLWVVHVPWLESSPCSMQLEKKIAQQQRPSTAKH